MGVCCVVCRGGRNLRYTTWERSDGEARASAISSSRGTHELACLQCREGGREWVTPAREQENDCVGGGLVIPRCGKVGVGGRLERDSIREFDKFPLSLLHNRVLRHTFFGGLVHGGYLVQAPQGRCGTIHL